MKISGIRRFLIWRYFLKPLYKEYDESDMEQWGMQITETMNGAMGVKAWTAWAIPLCKRLRKLAGAIEYGLK